MVAWFVVLISGAPYGIAEARLWTDKNGRQVEAQYASSSPSTVTIRTGPTQTHEVPIADLSEADQAYVRELRAAEEAASKVEVIVKGDVVWRLGDWSSLNWSSKNALEIWTWNEKEQRPETKLASLEAEYQLNYGIRNQFEGNYSTEKPIVIPAGVRLVVKSFFNVTYNNEKKALEDISPPTTLPQVKDGVIKLPTTRASARR